MCNLALRRRSCAPSLAKRPSSSMDDIWSPRGVCWIIAQTTKTVTTLGNQKASPPDLDNFTRKWPADPNLRKSGTADVGSFVAATWTAALALSASLAAATSWWHKSASACSSLRTGSTDDRTPGSRWSRCPLSPLEYNEPKGAHDVFCWTSWTPFCNVLHCI